ncbi:ACT domain-containing protein [Boeremia exigua]|uniref:ACT domain-containing protein n=1 Tax=Boeremia exigua TaxID=749465 RepID=UPI001E8DAE0A|nr:ACT domain-containing protein [Boeremia exigua]KAH6638997.1 ACT domain-containing protein [Boeremia exigua]
MLAFQDTRLALLHIPLHLYSNFLQSVLQLVLPSSSVGTSSNGSNGAVQPPDGWDDEQPFINISVTPVECSIVCSRKLVNEFFVPVLSLLGPDARSEIAITSEDFVVMQIDGEGLDADRRVLELTGPLALAGISIFFITSYYSDYILVPSRYRNKVIQALEDNGLRFEDQTSSYIHPDHYSRKSSVPTFEVQPPGTPPPATVSELQARTFATLKRRNIVPTVDSKVRLVQCGSRRDSQSNGSTTSAEDALHLGLVKCLISSPCPKFLSLTLADSEPASLLIDHTLLPNFSQDVLLGSKQEYLIPISLDLRDLPAESTGIVCGVAGRLLGETSEGFQEPVEMSYLSTARAGTVMVKEAELDRALQALRGVENGILSTPD